MSVKLLTEHNLEFLSLKGGCTDLSESIIVKMPHCWKSHALAHYYYRVNSPTAAVHKILLINKMKSVTLSRTTTL